MNIFDPNTCNLIKWSQGIQLIRIQIKLKRLKLMKKDQNKKKVINIY